MILAAGLGLGVFLLGYYHGYASEALNILFGNIFGISSSQLLLLGLIAVAVATVLTVIWRPLCSPRSTPTWPAPAACAPGCSASLASLILSPTATGMASKQQTRCLGRARIRRVAIFSPASNSIVSGIIQLRVNPGTNATGVHLAGYVDGQSLPGIIGVNDPAQFTRDIEIDTSWLTNGAHIFSVRVFSGADTISSPGTQSIDSAPIMLITSNRVTQANWQARAQLSLTVNLQGPSSVSNYAVTFFGVGYPKAQDPFGSCTFDLGVTTDGGMIYTNSPQQLGFGAGDTDPVIYSFTEFTAQPWGSASAPGDISMANTVILNDPPYPPLGEWVATYDDASVDYTLVTSAWFPVSDKQDLLGNFWVHGDQLNNGWLATGWFAGTDGTVAFPPDEDSNPTNSPAGQTWPIRGAESIMNPVGFHNDLLLFGNTLLDPSVRNFYGVGHGNPDQFMWLTGGPLPQRYRFAFLDGCESYSYANFSMFGAVQAEVQPQNASDDSNAGFVDTSYYESTGLRPAAFMGNVVNTKYCYPLDPQHPDLFYTSRHEYKVCYVRDIEALGNWHGQFLSYWMNVGWPLLMSKQQADILAWGSLMASSLPTLLHRSTSLWDRTPTGYPQYYSPITALKVAGFTNLHSTNSIMPQILGDHDLNCAHG